MGVADNNNKESSGAECGRRDEADTVGTCNPPDGVVIMAVGAVTLVVSEEGSGNATGAGRADVEDGAAKNSKNTTKQNSKYHFLNIFGCTTSFYVFHKNTTIFIHQHSLKILEIGGDGINDGGEIINPRAAPPPTAKRDKSEPPGARGSFAGDTAINGTPAKDNGRRDDDISDEAVDGVRVCEFKLTERSDKVGLILGER